MCKSTSRLDEDRIIDDDAGKALASDVASLRDEELLQLCSTFHTDHANWQTLASNNVVDPVRALADLASLRRSVRQLQALRPVTFAGAKAKLGAALTAFASTGDGDGEAAAFLFQASREVFALAPDDPPDADRLRSTRRPWFSRPAGASFQSQPAARTRSEISRHSQS